MITRKTPTTGRINEGRLADGRAEVETQIREVMNQPKEVIERAKKLSE